MSITEQRLRRASKESIRTKNGPAEQCKWCSRFQFDSTWNSILTIDINIVRIVFVFWLRLIVCWGTQQQKNEWNVQDLQKCRVLEVEPNQWYCGGVTSSARLYCVCICVCVFVSICSRFHLYDWTVCPRANLIAIYHTIYRQEMLFDFVRRPKWRNNSIGWLEMLACWMAISHNANAISSVCMCMMLDCCAGDWDEDLFIIANEKIDGWLEEIEFIFRCGVQLDRFSSIQSKDAPFNVDHRCDDVMSIEMVYCQHSNLLLFCIGHLLMSSPFSSTKEVSYVR